MKIVSVCACTSGIAHTYIAKEKLIRAAESMGHTIKVETQGTIGTEDELTAEEIKEADVVILAVDIAITGTERFEGKPTDVYKRQSINRRCQRNERCYRQSR